MDENDNRVKRYIWIGYWVIIALLVYQLAGSFITSRDTGTLKVNSSAANTKISISQDNHQASYIGTGSAKIRIAAGTYLLLATSNGNRTWATVVVRDKQTTSSYLNLVSPTTHILPSADSINFIGFDNFLNYGMPSSQLDNLRQAFFQYSKSIKTVTVDTSSINQARHDPNSASTIAIINFKVTVDSSKYNAVFNYDDLGNDYRLYLYNPLNNNLIFDSGVYSTPGGG